MVEVKYIKTQRMETEDKEITKLTFLGTHEGLEYQLTIKGEKYNVDQLLDDNKILGFGQKIEVELINRQTTIKDEK